MPSDISTPHSRLGGYTQPVNYRRSATELRSWTRENGPGKSNAVFPMHLIRPPVRRLSALPAVRNCRHLNARESSRKRPRQESADSAAFLSHASDHVSGQRPLCDDSRTGLRGLVHGTSAWIPKGAIANTPKPPEANDVMSQGLLRFVAILADKGGPASTA